MTAILTISSANTRARAARLLLVGASGLALSAPLAANELLFTTSEARPETGQRTSQSSGLTQVRLTGGGLVSIVDAASYRIGADGSLDLYEGTITVAAGTADEVVVRMPGGLEGRIAGAGAAGNFTARATGETSGHALTGTVQIGRADNLERFAAGQLWRASAAGRIRQVVANGAQVQPDVVGSETASVIPIGGDAGPVAAALNGLPTTFGDQLAAAGASGDIIAAARRIEAVAGNPVLDTFPSGDLALLVASAARLETAYGGTPFPAAQADITRAYLRFLAGGGAGSGFLAAYSSFAASYLDLIRAGGLPSGFAGVSPTDVESYLGYIRRTGALADLAARDRVLSEAYLAFLANGGDRDRFAASFTDLTAAYFAFVRGGGDPAAFSGASEAALAQTIAFLRDSGLVIQLGAADRALTEAYLANGGLAFAAQYRDVLGDYFAFLASGRRPSEYAAIDQATLQAYLETLANTGLLDVVLGERAGFYGEYLAFLRAGGDIDGFAGLPVNIFAGYAAQLAAYRAFLDAGNLPSAFAAADAAQLQAFIAELQAAGALERFLGADAAFFAAFADFVRGGGTFDAFGGLNANVFAGYASALQAYFVYLQRGGLPSAYEPLSQAVIAQYLAELRAAGALGRFLPQLGDFYTAYFAFLSGGGNPDTFAGLPVPPDFGAFADALNAYAAFLAGGGLPAEFTGADLAVLADFLTALANAGQLEARLGANATLLNAYFTFLAEGGAPNAFAGLPVYADYVAALNAYFAFLAGGGLPGDYTALDQATLVAYLSALQGAGGLTAFGDLNTFFADYFAFVSAGGNPANFAGLPIYAQYVEALNAYFAFLAGGGVPSAYTVLDQATINAYLDALAQVQGGLGSFGALNNFFVAYFAFLESGGEPDRFAGLPVNNGGGGGPPVTVTPFSGTVPGLTRVTSRFGIGGTSIETLTDSTVTFDSDGNIDTFTNRLGSTAGSGEPLADAVNEAGSIDGVIAWARFLDQPNAANSASVPDTGVHVIVGTPAVNLPASGLVSYTMIGGTRPTTNEGTEPAGSFSGALAVDFASMRVGIDFDVAIADRAWNLSTTGGATNPASGGFQLRSDRPTFFGSPTVTALNAASCTVSCSADAQGLLFGNGASHAGVVYRVTDGTFVARGAGVFAAPGAAGTPVEQIGSVGGGGTGGGGSFTYSGGFPDDSAGGRAFATSNSQLLRMQASSGILVSEDGVLQFAGSGRNRVAIGRGEAVDVAGDADLVVGRHVGSRVIFNDRATDFPLTGGVAYLVHSGFTGQLPASGTINYDLYAATRPVFASGAVEPGVFDARLTIGFGSSLSVGIDGTITMPEASGAVAYNFATTGRASGTLQPLSRDAAGELNFSTALSGAGGACVSGNCTIFFTGAFAGAGAGDKVGFTYQTSDNRNASTAAVIQGSAAFRTAQTGTNPYAGSGSATASITPSGPPTASIDLNRWGGTGSASPQGNVMPSGEQHLSLLPPGLAAGEVAAPSDAAARSDAIRQVERLMGGMITFPTGIAETR